MSAWRAFGAALLFQVVTNSVAVAQTTGGFVDVSAASGIGPYQMAIGFSGGIAAADFDDDGDIDVFVPNADGVPDQLYRNLGTGQFEEVAAAAGLASTHKNRCALWLDYDGDQDLDLFVANDVVGDPTAFRLFRQYADGLFEDVTQQAGVFAEMSRQSTPLLEAQYRGGICAGDINNDGYLDIFAAMWNGKSHLFVNNGDGTFTDASVSSGAAGFGRMAHQVMMVDFNKDGWLDIYENIDFGANLLWINQKNGAFVNVAFASGSNNSMNDMGMTLGDYDNDGDFDIYITNIFESIFCECNGHNVLLRNESIGSSVSFTEVSVALGVNNGGWGWGTTFMDADADGWLDIAATNGWRNQGFENDPSRFFMNSGGVPVSFIDESVAVNFDDTYWGSSLLAFDYDRDGDLDMMQSCMNGPLRMLENRVNGAIGGSNYLTVKPRMPGGTNYRAIGATVRIETGSLKQMRLISAGTSYQGQEPAEAYFGLGTAAMVDSVTVKWPDGATTTQMNVSANQVLTIVYVPAPPNCGDGACLAEETQCNCPIDCGLPTAMEIQGSTCSDGVDNDCDGHTDCDDSDCCNDGNSCTFDHCINGVCGFSASVYGDVDHNGVLNIFDLFCVLDGFSGDFSTCMLTESDIEPCGGNATINIFDLFAVLEAFSGGDPCCGSP